MLGPPAFDLPLASGTRFIGARMRNLASGGALRTVKLQNCSLDPELVREIAVGLCRSAVSTLDLGANERMMDAGHAQTPQLSPFDMFEGGRLYHTILLRISKQFLLSMGSRLRENSA